MSLSPGEALDGVRAWTASLDIGERLAKVRQKVAGFHREELELIAAATAAEIAVGLLSSKRQSSTTITNDIGVRQMGLSINDTAPDFEADTTQGRIRFHEWIADSWTVLFSHPKDFTPVCTTELGQMAKLAPEFERRGVKVIGLSVDSTQSHHRWIPDIEETQGMRPGYPIIGDTDLNVSKLYGMLPADAWGDASSRCALDNLTVRSVFVISPDKKIRLIIAYPNVTGRNFEELLRVIDSLQLTARYQVVTPANWRPGEDVMILNSVSDDQARAIFGEWKAVKPYIRIVPGPSAWRSG